MAICFHNQWRDGEGNLKAIPHATTTNTSFLRMCSLLKRMNLKNYAFPLTLYDPDLKNIDVYDLEDDTPENEILRTKVMIEARLNGWYYLRECVRIYEQGGKPISFRLDRGSCAMAWCFFNGLDYCGMQPRQTGKAQPLHSAVLTDKGWIRMGDITTDMQVVTPSGELASVVGIYPQGRKSIYRITLEDGRYTECTRDHLWKVYCPQWENPWDIINLDDVKLSKYPLYIPLYDADHTSEQKLSKVVDVKFVGMKKAQCIEIDHPDHLYVTDDCIVTHNTVCALSLTSWVLYSAGEEFQIGMMAKDNSLRQENVKRVKSFGENLPKWWLIEDRYKDKKNAEEIFYNQLRTHYVTFVAQSEKSAADKQARGASPPMFHFDEFEFTTNVGISYPTILASTGTARENAKKNNKPHSNIITTTAGDPTKPECKEAMTILDGAMPFTELLYDIEDNEKLHQIVAAASPQKMILGVFSHLQLGYDNAWLRDKINRNRMTADQTMRDYLNRRVSIQEAPIIPKHTLAEINSSQCDPDHIHILHEKFVIYWYISKAIVESAEFKNRSIVVGCDSSEMIGRDSTTLIGIDPSTLETVFSFKCSEGNINVLGSMIGKLLLMFPKMVWVPENKSSGTSLIDIVALILRKAGHNPFTRIFNHIVDRRHELEYSRIDIRNMDLLDTSMKKYFGIKTDKSRREELYGSTLLEGTAKAPSKIKDRNLVQELNSLTVRNGRVDHAVGGHDDTVVAWLMAMWFILSGRHHDLYGIKPGTVLSYIVPGQPNKSKLSEDHQLKIRAKIEELEQNLKYQRDPALRRLIEADLTLVKSMINYADLPTPVTADEFTRDPQKFTDPVIAAQSKPPVSKDDIERSLRMVLNM